MAVDLQGLLSGAGRRGLPPWKNATVTVTVLRAVEIYTLATDMQMASSPVEDHLQRQSTFSHLETAALRNYCFRGRLVSRGLAMH
jgi:hypothetical protein